MLYVIETIKPHPDIFTVEITYSDHVTIHADFKPLIERGGVMAGLADPAAFAAVRIGPRGRSLVFNDAIDFCADGIREKFSQPSQAAA
jgi:hypothetical protein